MTPYTLISINWRTGFFVFLYNLFDFSPPIEDKCFIFTETADFACQSILNGNRFVFMFREKRPFDLSYLWKNRCITTSFIIFFLWQTIENCSKNFSYMQTARSPSSMAILEHTQAHKCDRLVISRHFWKRPIHWMQINHANMMECVWKGEHVNKISHKPENVFNICLHIVAAIVK